MREVEVLMHGLVTDDFDNDKAYHDVFFGLQQNPKVGGVIWLHVVDVDEERAALRDEGAMANSPAKCPPGDDHRRDNHLPN